MTFTFPAGRSKTKDIESFGRHDLHGITVAMGAKALKIEGLRDSPMPSSHIDFMSKRLHERQRRLLKARMRHPRHGEVDILVRDVSERGLGGRCDLDIAVGENVVIGLPDCAPVEGKIAWRKGQGFGVLLEASINPATVKSPPPSESPAAAPYQVPTAFRASIDMKRPGFRTRSPGPETKRR